MLSEKETIVEMAALDYPRVTEILRPFTSYEFVPKKILENAKTRGTVVHALCAGIAKGNWIPESMVAEELQGYVKSFKQWAEAQVDKFVIVEQRFLDEHLLYTGQVDFVVKSKDGELYLVDLKTGSKPQKTHKVQMAAYENLLGKANIRIKGAMLVYLSREGEFPEIDMIEESDFMPHYHCFLSALDCYNYFKRKRKKKNGSDTSESGTESSSEADAERLPAHTCCDGRTELYPEG